MLVDTSVWIDFFNGHLSGHAERLARAIEDAEPIVVPGLVLTEILLGLKTESEAKRIATLMDAFEAARETTHTDYVEAAAIYRLCRAKGITVRSTIDCLIARLCLRDDLPLLSRDRDFNAIARCTPLRLVAV